MPGFDERLTRELENAARPAAPDPVRLFNDVARRRARRDVSRRIQAGVLSFFILAAIAGGFLAFSRTLDEPSPPVGNPFTANGEIVFSKDGPDGRGHLFAIHPDGTGIRQITNLFTDDTAPAVSPDGQTIAFVQTLQGGAQMVATVPIEGGAITWQTPQNLRASDPAWSPDSTRIVFVSHPIDSTALAVTEANGEQQVVTLEIGIAAAVADPSWSPDGTQIAFAIQDGEPSGLGTWDLATIGIDGSGFGRLVSTPDADETAPAWSPDGREIAYVSTATQGPDVGLHLRTVSPSGEVLRPDILARGGVVDAPSWAPNGQFLVFQADFGGEMDVWVVRLDGSDLRQATTRGGESPTWQPAPEGSALPSVEPTNEPRNGRDIGLGSNICEDTRLGGLDLVPGGERDIAWTGYAVNDQGRCPRNPEATTWLVAVDVTGDGLADASARLLEPCVWTGCAPLGATDLDADGDEELVVMTQFSIIDHFFFSVRSTEGTYVIEPILVAEPGHLPAGIEPGAPLMTSAAGDEGYAAWIRCEGYPEAPVLVFTFVSSIVESPEPHEWHETKLRLQDDGMFHVVGTSDFTLPGGQDPGLVRSHAPACGVDFSPMGASRLTPLTA